jgi:hypothetical protein
MVVHVPSLHRDLFENPFASSSVQSQNGLIRLIRLLITYL